MRSSRRGFTLPELLAVIAILLILTTITVLSLRPTTEGRIREASRISQAAFAGARDRASHFRQHVGIRLLTDPQDATVANALQYVRRIDPQPYGNVLPFPTNRQVQVTRVGTLATEVQGFGTDWLAIRDQGLIGDSFPVQIPAGYGIWYTAYDLRPGTNPGEEAFSLTESVAHADTMPPEPIAIPRESANASVAIQPLAELMPGQEPIPLPSGVVIDLSVTPLGRDLMFSPSGHVIAEAFPIYLLLRDVRDAGKPIAAAEHEQLVLTINPRTGRVGSSPVAEGDPFLFAKQGSAAQ